MISIYELKPRFQRLLKPILEILHKLGFTANKITISSILLSLVVGIFFWLSDYNRVLFWVVPIGLLIRMALNALDGMMAINYNQQSILGEVLNEIGDIISDLFIYFPLLIHFEKAEYLIVSFLCLSIVNEFSGLLSKVTSNVRRYDGPMGKSDRAFVISCIAILLYFDFLVIEYQFEIFLTINFLILVSTMIRLNASLKSNE